MKLPSRWMLTLSALALGVALPVAGTAPSAQPNTLTAKKVAAAPALDGTMDAAWKAAPPMTVKVVGGRGLQSGSTEVSLRALYTADTVYFLMQYKDETNSIKREPWQKQADGSWKKLGDPNDKGGDNNLYYEDKWAMIWNISSPAFEQRGCFSACHTGEGKAFGNKYTPNPNERLDLWHMKGVRTSTVGQVDDQYVDGTRYDKDKTPEAGRKSDPNTGGGYSNNVSDDKKGPKFALPGNKPAPPYWILNAEKEPFDDSKYKAGDEVPGIIVAAYAGDRGDISAKVVYADGVRTSVFSRKLNTGSEYDIQFTDLKKEYAFGVAVFDNAQVRHAYSPGVLRMRFE
jgi:hypothetical protein